jgi:hypothetical protein
VRRSLVRAVYRLTTVWVGISTHLHEGERNPQETSLPSDDLYLAALHHFHLGRMNGRGFALPSVSRGSLLSNLTVFALHHPFRGQVSIPARRAISSKIALPLKALSQITLPGL